MKVGAGKEVETDITSLVYFNGSSDYIDLRGYIYNYTNASSSSNHMMGHATLMVTYMLGYRVSQEQEMAGLTAKIKLYLEANSKTLDLEKDNMILQNDGSGDYIKSWSVIGLDKPTDEQLASYETAANKEILNNNVRKNRKLAYGDIGEQLDEIYKDIDAWKKRIKKIKEDNPKG